MEKIIELKNINKSYGKGVKALNDVSLTVFEGDIFDLVGSNGAGKSTILKLLSGAILKDSGDISILGNTNDDIIKSFSKMGFLIERPNFYGDLTGLDNLKYLCKLRGLDLGGALEIAKEFGIENALKKKIKGYSTGMRQRLGLVVTFMHRPEILVLDEPINGLDPEGITYLRNYILNVNRKWNSTVIISSHILNELSLIANRYALIKNGKIIEEVSRTEVEEKSKKYICIEVDKEDLSKTTALLEMNFEGLNYNVYPHGEIRIFSDLDRKKLQKFLVDNSVYVTTIKEKGLDLEDYYLEKIGGEND